MPEKPCICCHKVKPLDDYYNHPEMADKHLNKCKECCKAQAVLNSRSEKGRQRDRDRYKDPKRKQYVFDLAYKKFQENPDLKKLYSTVSNALRDGRIIRGVCEVCGESENVEAHHDDYTKPLEIRWLCRKHHHEHHRTRKDIVDAPDVPV